MNDLRPCSVRFLLGSRLLFIDQRRCNSLVISREFRLWHRLSACSARITGALRGTTTGNHEPCRAESLSKMPA